MTDVDPRDYIDMYIVEVKPSAFSDTSLTEDDLDEDWHANVFSHTIEGGEHKIEFTSEQGAEKLIEEWNQSLDFLRRGGLSLRNPHASDESDTDAYLLFKPG